jgi:hypothetical protein
MPAQNRGGLLRVVAGKGRWCGAGGLAVFGNHVLARESYGGRWFGAERRRATARGGPVERLLAGRHSTAARPK